MAGVHRAAPQPCGIDAAPPTPGIVNRSDRDPSIAVLTQQISHYHAARYRASAAGFGRLTVLSAMNDADFREFLSSDAGDIEASRLFDGRQAYMAAVSSGDVWSRTRSVLDRLRPEVVVIAGWSFPESVGAIAWAHDNDARIVMMSESQEQDGPRHRLREIAKSRIVRICHAALVGGRRHSGYITRLGMPAERVFHGYDAVDNRHFSDGADRARVDAVLWRQKLGLPDRYLLASARFIPKKNLEGLVAAFAQAVAAADVPHALVILGDGEGRGALEAAVAAAGVQHRVLLAGFKGYDSLPAFYGLADAFVHVSLAEQWGLVINEAAAAGLPLIVSHPCGAAPELVAPGANGYLVEPADIGDMARALAALMTATDEARHAMGDESRRIVADWGPERFARGLRDAADAALASPVRWLAPWDRMLLRMLSRRYISTVS
ncbi:glycosyltransferase [Labrys monachus]|nr:glycosyltransferase [Labrys monachus]